MRKKMKITVKWILPLLLLSAPVWAQDSAYIINDELLKTVRDEVSGERAWDWMSKISRYHRIRGGGEGSDYNRCVEWLAHELENMGVRDVNVYNYKADGLTKSFLWKSLIGWRVKDADLWLTEPVKKRIARFSDQAVSLMPYSQGGKVEADVIFVGEGKSPEDYRDLDVENKLVFAIGGGGSKVHRMAVIERGAAGVIVGPSHREDRLSYPDLIEVNRISIKKEEQDKASFGFSLSRRQVRELLSYFDAGKRVHMRAEIEAELFDGDMPVIEAVLPGKDFPQQEIIIMGHLDHYKPGANDNASGSAGMMEMVKNILDLRRREEIPPLKRTIRFLWLPEMHGTAPYLVEHENIGKRGIAGINLDMIGDDYALCETTFNLFQSPYSVPGYINDILVNLLGWLEGKEFFSPRGKRYRFNPRILPYSGGSDHVMFNDSHFAVPTPMLSHKDVFWHTNFDTPDKCDPTEMKRAISLALASSIFLADATDEEALHIAGEVFSQACLRMARRTQQSIHILQNTALNPDDRCKLPELYANVRVYPDYLAGIEAANIREVKELCSREQTKRAIEDFASDIELCTAMEIRKLDKTYAILADLNNITKEPFKPDELYKTAASLKPQRLFKGPLPYNFLEEKLNKADLDWYRINKPKDDRFFDSKMFELVNLMDGRRSVLDIRHIISCEFDEIEMGFVLRVVQLFEKIGLITF